MFTFTKKNSPGLHVLGGQIRCAQNRYTAVQMDLKYFQQTKLGKCFGKFNWEGVIYRPQ